MHDFALLMEILLINLILSGDNAVVIAMASKNLPEHQKKTAIWWGTLGAVFLRIVLSAMIVIILMIPYIKTIGALFLIYIAVKLLVEDEEAGIDKPSHSLWNAIRTIVIADFIMSLDNVLAIAAVANNHFLLIALGIALSIPIVIFGSNLLAFLLKRFPFLNYLGAGILGYTAGGILMEDTLWQQHFNSSVLFHIVVSAALTLFVVAAGYFFRKRKKIVNESTTFDKLL